MYRNGATDATGIKLAKAKTYHGDTETRRNRELKFSRWFVEFWFAVRRYSEGGHQPTGTLCWYL